MPRGWWLAATAVLALAPVTASGQRNVAAVGTASWNDANLLLQLGRELLPDSGRLGVRAHIDYARVDISLPSWTFASSETGIIARRSVMVQHQSRAVGISVSASYAPVKWYVTPYVIGGAGLQDSHQYFRIPASDSATVDGVFFPSRNEHAQFQNRFGLSFNAGVGARIRFGGVSLFSEVRRIVDPYLADLSHDYRRSSRAMTIGLRY